MPHNDQIHLQGLSISTHIGVPEEERALPQRLSLNLTLWPKQPLTGLSDNVAGTIDYGVVAIHVRKLAAERPRQLIETLAEEILTSLFQHFPLQQVRVEVRKFILPDTESVSVCITRTNPLS